MRLPAMILIVVAVITSQELYQLDAVRDIKIWVTGEAVSSLPVEDEKLGFDG
jgi:hypothetical protein